jgi:hypothetical protein
MSTSASPSLELGGAVMTPNREVRQPGVDAPDRRDAHVVGCGRGFEGVPGEVGEPSVGQVVIASGRAVLRRKTGSEQQRVVGS